MVCPCCVPARLCCCEGDATTDVASPDECAGNTTQISDPPVSVNDISIVVEWSGLTVVCDTPFVQGQTVYFSGSASAAVDFLCQRTRGDDPFDAFERAILVNFTGSNTQLDNSGCWRFTSNITFNFNGTYPATGFGVIAVVGRAASLSECRKSVEVMIGDDPFWCPDNPYGDSFTAELIIAP